MTLPAGRSLLRLFFREHLIEYEKTGTLGKPQPTPGHQRPQGWPAARIENNFNFLIGSTGHGHMGHAVRIRVQQWHAGDLYGQDTRWRGADNDHMGSLSGYTGERRLQGIQATRLPVPSMADNDGPVGR